MVSLLRPARDVPAPGYDILILPGQSNTVGRGKGEFGTWSGPLGYDDRLFQIGRTGGFDKLVIPCVEPLHFWDPAPLGQHSYGLPLARLYAAYLTPPRKVLIVPAAWGGTSVYEWLGYTGRTQLWPDMVDRISAALNAPGQPRLVGWFENQMEQDIVNAELGGPNAAAYTTAKLELIDRFQTAYPNVPMFFGRMTDDWVPTDPVKAAFLAALDAAVALRSNCYVVDTAGFPSNFPIDGAETIHFSALGLGMLARAYFDSWLAQA